MRTKIFADAFKNIRSFAFTKALNYKGRQNNAANQISFMMRHRYERDLRYAFERYRYQVQKTVNKNTEKFNAVIRRYATQGLRNAFTWWKKQDEKEKLVDYNYYVGPVRADYWEASREIDNLKNFMREERFTESQIESTVHKISN